MALESKYEKLLELIHDSDHERILYSEVVREDNSDHSELIASIKFLEEKELIEFDKHDNAYYLTTEGYDTVEAYKTVSKFGGEMTQAEYEHLLKSEHSENKGKMYNSILAILGLLMLIAFFFMLRGISVSDKVRKDKINQDVVDFIKNDMERIVDSVRQVNENGQIIPDTIIENE